VVAAGCAVMRVEVGKDGKIALYFHNLKRNRQGAL
jgi:hypothetical protein